jgi:hypothetical protein
MEKNNVSDVIANQSSGGLQEVQQRQRPVLPNRKVNNYPRPLPRPPVSHPLQPQTTTHMAFQNDQVGPNFNPTSASQVGFNNLNRFQPTHNLPSNMPHPQLSKIEKYAMENPTFEVSDESDGSQTFNELPADSSSDKVNPNVPSQTYATDDKKSARTNLGNTSLVMAILSEMWVLNIIFVLGGTYCWNFLLPPVWTNYTDLEFWNNSCWWKIRISFINSSLAFTFAIYFNLFFRAVLAV